MTLLHEHTFCKIKPEKRRHLLCISPLFFPLPDPSCTYSKESRKRKRRERDMETNKQGKKRS